MSTPQALSMILREHEALAAVLRTLPLLVRDARRRNAPPEFRVMRAMLFYIEEFPERLHHVKESAMLFPRLRERTRDADATIARLDRDHAGGPARLRELAHRLTAWELLGEPRRQAFESALAEYVAAYLDHIRCEEDELLPLARAHLTDADWHILHRAFGGHRDALAGGRPEAEYEALFALITRITPAPYGLGDGVAAEA